MKERILALRKSLNLSQQAFADRLGIKRTTISNYEIGRNEPVDSVVSLICREFGVREAWLRTGELPMKAPDAPDPLLTLIRSRGYSDRVYVLVANILRMPTDSQDAIMSFMESVVADLAELPDETDHRAALHAELDRQLDEEKRESLA